MHEKLRPSPWIFLALTLSSLAGAQTPSLESRVDQLEKRQKELYLDRAEGKQRVVTFLGEKINFGGFYEHAITGLYGPDTKSQLSANSNILGLNVGAEFNDNWRFVSQIIFGLSFSLTTPNLPSRAFATPAFGALPAQAYVEYTANPAFVLQTGLGYVPFGVAFQQREPVLFRLRNGPLILMAGSLSHPGIASPLWMGVHAQGSFDFGENRVGYDGYTLTPGNNAKTLGGGARLWWAFSDLLTLGASFQGGHLAVGSYRSFGADLDVRHENYGMTLEYGRSSNAAGAPGPESYYAEPWISVMEGKFVAFAHADYLDHPTNTAGLAPDPIKFWRFGGGLNWLPLVNTRFRLEYLVYNYVGSTAVVAGLNRDYSAVDLSAGIAF